MSRTSSRLPLLGLAGIVLAGALYAVYYGLRAHVFQPDEFNAVLGARMFVDKPLHALVDTQFFTRGPERLSAILLALPDSFLSSTANEFRAAHVLLALCSALAAVPAYLLGRGLGLKPWQAVVAGALTIVTPWLIYATTLLNVTLGFPLTALFLFVTWRATVRPSVGGDAAVLVVALLNTAARVGHITFIAVAAVAVLVQTWRERPPRETLLESARRFPPRVWRRHPLLVVAGAVVLGIVLWLGPYRLVGQAYSANVPAHIGARELWDKLRLLIAELGMGTGYLPLLVGAPWAIREAVRPRRPESGAFGVIAVAMFVIFVFTDVTAVNDERYVAVLAALPAIAFAAALFRREATVIGTILAGVVLARCVVTQGLYPDQQPFSYFVGPARQFFTRVIEGHTSVTLSGISHVATVALVIITALAALLALLHSRRPPARLRPLAGGALAVAVVGVLAAGAAAAQWNTHRFTQMNTFPTLTFEQQTIIDQASHGRPVALWDQGQSLDPGPVYEIAQEQFFNGSLQTMIVMPGERRTWNRGFGGQAWAGDIKRVLVDPRTGLMRLRSGTMPRYLASFQGYRAFGFASHTILRSNVFGPHGLRLDRFDGPPRVLWRIRGPAGDGWLPPGRSRATITAIAPPRHACLRLTIHAPSGPTPRFPYVLRSGRFRRSGSMRYDQYRTILMPLDGRSATLTSFATGQLPGPRPAGIGVTEDVAILRCAK